MIDLTTAKQHLRVDTTDENGLIGAYLLAAQKAVETATSKPLTAVVVTQVVDGFPPCGRAIRLWKGPVADTPAPTIAYDDTNGVEQTLADFRLVDGAMAQLLPAYGDQWPADAQSAIGSVRVTYTAGYDGGSGVPPELDQAVLLLVGHYYHNREAAIGGDRAAAAELPLGVAMLIAPYCAPGIA